MVWKSRRARTHRKRRYFKRPYYRRRWRRHRHKHPYRFGKRQVITTRRPRKWVTVYIRGWEPCGIVGGNTTFNELGQITVREAIKNGWESNWGQNYLNKANANDTKWEDFAGGFGMATINLNSLIIRCNRGLAQSSHDISQFTNGRWVGATFYPIKLPSIDWVIYYDTHFSKEDKDYQTRKKWLNPLHLMLLPGKTFVPNWKKSPGKPWVRKKKLPSVNTESEFVDKTWLGNVALISYYFSIVDLTNPIGPPDKNSSATTGKDFRNYWFKCKCFTWMNRPDWDKQFAQQKTSDWAQWVQNFWKNHILGNGQSPNGPKQAPFCPPFSISETLECMSFFYQFKFQFTGNSFAATNPGSAANEVREPEQCNGGCPNCLTQKDLDRWGLIKKRKFRQLTRFDNKNNICNSRLTKKEKKKNPFSSKKRFYRYVQEVLEKYS